MKLLKSFVFVFLVFATSAQTVFAQSDGTEQTQTDIINELGRKFIKAVKSDDDKEAVTIADEIFENQFQGQFNENFSGYFFINAAYAYWREDENEKALQCAENLTRLNEGYRQAIGYKLKFYLSRDKDEYDNEDFETSYQALNDFFKTTLGDQAAEDAAEVFIPQKYISSFLRDLKSDNDQNISDVKFKTYASIFNNGFVPEKPFSTLDYWRKQYVLGLLERGEIKQAKQMAVKITKPSVLRSMYVDKSYKKLWNISSLKDSKRVMKAFDNDVEHLKRLVKKHPDSLQGRQHLIKSYATIGRLNDAENLAVKTLKEMENFGSFTDDEDYKNWIFNEIAYVYYEKGDYERGNSYMLRAANTVEGGSTGNVSQVINYTAKLLNQGEYQKALDFQDKFMPDEGASDYGDMWVWYNQACGYHKLGQTKKSNIAMKKLADNRENNYAAYSMSLLCAGKIDAAAQSYIERLKNPDFRSGALDAMQKSRLSKNIMPLDKELQVSLEKVRSRPDVIATANKYGRIETWPLSNTYWGDF